MTDKPVDQYRQAPVLTNYAGHRKEGFGSKFTAVVAAVGVGIEAMSSKGDGLTIGGATGTALGAVGAYLVTGAIDASVSEGAVIGALAGGLGSLAATTIDTKLSSEAGAKESSASEALSLLRPLSLTDSYYRS